LKLHIERDLKPDEIALAANRPIDVGAAVAYYTNNIDYHRACLAGAARYDLKGERAGTVTEAEAIAAQQRVVEIRRMLRERREQEQQELLTPVGRVLQSLRAPDDQFRKVPAPTPPKPPTHAERNREIARRYASGESSTALAREFDLSPRGSKPRGESSGHRVNGGQQQPRAVRGSTSPSKRSRWSLTATARATGLRRSPGTAKSPSGRST
jgi:hypothetical protein